MDNRTQEQKDYGYVFERFHGAIAELRKARGTIMATQGETLLAHRLGRFADDLFSSPEKLELDRLAGATSYRSHPRNPDATKGNVEGTS